jgi:hypothetical protein
MDHHLTTSRPAGRGGMTSQEHAAQRSAVRASLLTDSARFTHHDVYPLRDAGTCALTAVPSAATSSSSNARPPAADAGRREAQPEVL